ncbi:MAG: hypothetical protein ABIP35_16745 [Ginsengibacter sp.]
MKKLKIWYIGLSEKKQLAFTVLLLLAYWFFAWLFFEKMVWQGNRPLWFGLFYSLCLSVGLTVLFQWNKVKRVLKRGEEE